MEGDNTSVGPSTPKQLKTEPVPQAKDKNFASNGAWYRHCSAVLVDFHFFQSIVTSVGLIRLAVLSMAASRHVNGAM